MQITGKVFTGGAFISAAVTVHSGYVQSIEPVPARKDQDYILPGLVDVHTHGAFGADFTRSDTAALAKALRFYAQQGTTALLATTVTDSKDNLLQAAKRLRELAAPGGARVLGTHMEGPFFGREKRGAQAEAYLCEPDLEFLDAYIACASNVKLISFDPTLQGSKQLLQAYAQQYTLSVGHTACDYAAACAAYTAGARWLTHALNAMAPPLSREPGPLAAALEHAKGIELICDTIHVHPFWLRTLFTLAPERVVMVSDSVSATGMPDGGYTLGGEPVYKRGGVVRTPDGALAGAAATLFEGVRAAVGAGVPLARAVAAASKNPARLLQLDAGSIAPGRRADLLRCSENLGLKQVYLGGKEI